MKQTTIPTKTYATFANADKAVRAKFENTDLRYLIAATPEGRFFPVLIGQEAVQAQAHFHFSVVG